MGTERNFKDSRIYISYNEQIINNRANASNHLYCDNLHFI